MSGRPFTLPTHTDPPLPKNALRQYLYLPTLVSYTHIYIVPQYLGSWKSRNRCPLLPGAGLHSDCCLQLIVACFRKSRRWGPDRQNLDGPSHSISQSQLKGLSSRQAQTAPGLKSDRSLGKLAPAVQAGQACITSDATTSRDAAACIYAA